MDRTACSDPLRSAKGGARSDFLQYSIASRGEIRGPQNAAELLMKKAPPEGGALTEALPGSLEHEP